MMSIEAEQTLREAIVREAADDWVPILALANMAKRVGDSLGLELLSRVLLGMVAEGAIELGHVDNDAGFVPDGSPEELLNRTIAAKEAGDPSWDFGLWLNLRVNDDEA